MSSSLKKKTIETGFTGVLQQAKVCYKN